MSPGLSTPPLVVLDTNVLLDLLWFRDARAQPLANALDQGALVALSCPATRRELVHQLTSTRLAAWAGPMDAQAAAQAALARHDRWVQDGADPPGLAACHARLRCTDRDDQVFVDLALARGAWWLLSHDRAVLKLARQARRLGLHIVTPGQWHEQALSSAGDPAAETGHEKGQPKLPL